MMTNKNVILEGDFLIFDVNDTKTRKECWSRTTPRKVKATFEKSLPNASYCLRLIDPTRKVKPLYYHLDKTIFCGTDSGDLAVTKPYMYCLKHQQSYKFLTVFIGSEVSPNDTSCVLMRTTWDEPDQQRWQTIINQTLGLTQIWSVRNTDIVKDGERVLLCLTEQGLALNSKNFNKSKFPKCIWYCSFSNFTIMPNYDNQAKALDIICTRKGVSRTDRQTYRLFTSNGQEIVSVISKACGLVIPNHIANEDSHQNSRTGEAAPPPCPNTQVLVCTQSHHVTRDHLGQKIKITPLGEEAYGSIIPNESPLSRIPTPLRPLPLPPVKNDSSDDGHDSRRKQPIRRQGKLSFSNSRSLRRSFSVGQSSKNRLKLMLREKVSYSGGYGSDTEDNYQMPKAIHVKADRPTLYMHNQWYQSFKADVEDSPPQDPEPNKNNTSPEPLRKYSNSSTPSRKSSHQTTSDYWTTEISFSLQQFLEKVKPDPDTLKLGSKQKIRLSFMLYPSGLLGCGWQELGSFLGLTSQESDMLEHFCLFHQKIPAEVLLHHWQFVHNKQTKQKLTDPNFVPVCPPCTKERLVYYLYEMGRLDIIQSCNFQLPNTEEVEL